MEPVTAIEKVAVGIVTKLGESPLIIGVFILILLVGILLLVFAYMAQRWARKSCEQQERLNVLFEDQMFLLGKYNKDLMKLTDILSGLKESLLRRGDLEPVAESVSSPAEGTTEVAAGSDSSEGEGSITATSEEYEKEDENYEQQVSAGKKLIEKRLRALAQESNIRIREVSWYRRPSMIGSPPYSLMVSTRGKPRECRFSEKELADFLTGGSETEGKLRDLINGFKKKRKQNTCLGE
jgi:hypothetical protein